MALKAMSIIQVEEIEECINMEKWIGIEAPHWMKLSILIGKWILLMVVFISSSISMSYGNDPQGIWTAIWCLTMVKIVDMADNK